MQPDTEHINSKPRQAGDDIAKYGQHRDAPFVGVTTPASVQNDRVPNHDEERSVFLWIPTPEAPPGLIGPNTAKNRTDEAKQSGETDDSVDHAPERFRSRFIERFRQYAANDVNDSQKSSEKCRRIAESNRDNVSRKPDVCV